MGQTLFFILSSVRRDWSKVVVPIAVVGSWCKGWDKASPLFWSHSVKSGADPLFFLFIPLKLWWASFLLILALKLPRASLDSPLSSFSPIYRCSYHKELQSKGFKRCGWGGVACEEGGNLGATWLLEECEKYEYGVAEVLLGATEWKTGCLGKDGEM